MKCWYPIAIPKHIHQRIYEFSGFVNGVKKSYTSSNGRLLEKKQGYIYVPCGRCPACRRRKQNEWAFRIMEEAKHSRYTAFVTLTIDDDHLKFTPSGLATLDPDRLHKFFKDLRYNFPFRYFACGEYGDKFGRPHYHFILFYSGSLSPESIESFIKQRWPDGNVQIDSPVSAGRAKYCAKYSMKQVGFDYGDVIPPFSRMSRRPGIGKNFLDQLNFDRFRKLDQWHVHDYQGTPYPLPRYYKERIYSRDEIETHSDLMLRTSFTEEEYNKTLSDLSEHDFYKHEMETNVNRERIFIKHLEKENYGFKWKPKTESESVRLDTEWKRSGLEFSSDEF